MLGGWENGEKIAVVLLGTVKRTGKALPDTPCFFYFIFGFFWFCFGFFWQLTGEFTDQITSLKTTEQGRGIEQPHCLSLQSFL